MQFIIDLIKSCSSNLSYNARECIPLFDLVPLRFTNVKISKFPYFAVFHKKIMILIVNSKCIHDVDSKIKVATYFLGVPSSQAVMVAL